VRTLIPLVVFLLILYLPRSAVAESTACTPDVEATSDLGVVEEAFNLLTLLYVDRLPPGQLLNPAADAVREKLEPEASGETGVERASSLANTPVATWAAFAGEYCALWTAAPNEMEPDALAHTAIRAMVRAVDEGHTRFLTRQMYEDHQAWANGDMRYDGIGARLRSSPLTIQYVFPESPAANAGLAYGDQIIAIDGVPAADLPASDAVLLMRGETGSSVRLTIQRPETDGQWDVDVARAKVSIPLVETRMIGDVAYMRIQGFPTTDLPDTVQSDLRAFEAADAKALVLDLRGNSGGRIDVGSEIASYFLPNESPIYRQTSRRGQTTTAMSGNDRIWSKPIVALIDDGTASMGEIMAASLQEEGVAMLLGSQTAGSVAGSVVVPLSDGAALQVTTLRIDSGLGTPLNGVGVSPDVSVESPPGETADAQDVVLSRALEQLHAQLGDLSRSRDFAAPDQRPQ